MPQMGYDMQEGTLVRWLKSVGDEVSLGEAVAEIETDKAVVEFESTAEGILRKMLVEEGTTVAVGESIALVGKAEDEEIAGNRASPAPVAELEPEPAGEPAMAEPEQEAPAVERDGATPTPTAIAVPMGEVRASPVARKLAAERGVNLTQVQGTGPGGRIVKSDVMAAEPSTEVLPAPVEAPAEAPAPVAVPVPKPAPAPVTAGKDELVPLSRMRQQIARVTVGSKTTIPHFYVTTDIDMTEAMALRKQINDNLKDDGVRVSVNDLIIKTCVNTLKKHPKFNASFTDDGIQMRESINVGIAIAEEYGLIMPAILDCGHKSLAEIAAASKDLVDRSQNGTLHPQEYTGGTFSISNMGMFDVTSFVSIIQPPQSGVLAVGTVQKRPVVRGVNIVVRDMMSATLSVDHRVSDGAEGAKFIVEIKNQLERPLKLLM